MVKTIPVKYVRDVYRVPIHTHTLAEKVTTNLWDEPDALIKYCRVCHRIIEVLEPDEKEYA